MKKKILTFLVAICLIIPCLFGLAACKPKEKVATKTMTTSINPEITFMLDSKNNVTSISYGNADAGRLFANVNFVGQDASTAIQIVIEQTAISGHIDLSGDTVTFEFSGEDIEKLKTDVEAKAKEVFKQMGVAITVTIKEISAEVKHQTLISTAKVLAPEMDSTEIENMSDEDLIKLIDKKQQDYKDLAYDQINDLQKNLDQAILNTINAIRAEMEKLEAEMEKYGETIKQQYNNCKKQLEDEINKFLDERKEKIAEAEKLAEAHKDALIALYKQEVEKTETIFKAHLEAAKANGIITEAQYNYWINLINSNKA